MFRVLCEVRRVATMKDAGFDLADLSGPEENPTDVIRRVTKLWRETWIVDPLRKIIEMLNKELDYNDIEYCDACDAGPYTKGHLSTSRVDAAMLLCPACRDKEVVDEILEKFALCKRHAMGFRNTSRAWTKCSKGFEGECQHKKATEYAELNGL
jgi:hypothetical protein